MNLEERRREVAVLELLSEPRTLVELHDELHLRLEYLVPVLDRLLALGVITASRDHPAPTLYRKEKP